MTPLTPFYSMPPTLEGKKVLITGASRGIGAATARVCKAWGALPVLHASRMSEALESLAEELEIRAGTCLVQDFAKEGAGDLFERAVDGHGALDALVNNAGVYLPTALGASDADWADAWETTMRVNLRAPADLCRAAIAHFRSKGAGSSAGGRIVNIASRAGHRGDGPDHSAYAASKGGLLALSKTLARAHAGENIHVYTVAPGWVETRMAPQDIENRKKAAGEIPLGRVADPREVANLIAYLLTDGCPSATGATFDVNGASYVR